MSLRSFPDYRYDDLSPMRGAAMFEKKDPLPRAELHFTIDDGDDFARARQDHPDVRSAVVRAFIIVFVVCIFRHEPFEKFLQVAPGRGRRIFHDDETATRMARKHSHGAGFDFALGDSFSNLLGDFVRSFAACRDFEIFCVRVHHLAQRPTYVSQFALQLRKHFASLRRAGMFERITPGGESIPAYRKI
jgi:hypothetical protein